MAKPDLVLIEGGKVELAETPDRVDFKCHDCKLACVMYPHAKPIAVQHQIPSCKAWREIEKKKDDLARFLIKCGVHVLVPEPGGDVTH